LQSLHGLPDVAARLHTAVKSFTKHIHKTLCFPEVKKGLAGDYTAVEMFVKQLKTGNFGENLQLRAKIPLNNRNIRSE